jgi:hypothetical protein
MYSIIFKRACVTSCDVQRSQCQAGVLSVPHTGATKRRHYFRLTQKKNNSKFNNQIPTDHTTQQITQCQGMYSRNLGRFFYIL